MAKKASIDIGTNTILLLIAEIEAGSGSTKQVKKVWHDEQTFVRLGQGVNQNRAFLPEAMERAYECLQKYKGIIDQHKVAEIKAVATSASRDAKIALSFTQRLIANWD